MTASSMELWQARNHRAGGVISPTLARFLVAGGISYLVNQATLFLLYEVILSGPGRPIAAGPLRFDPALGVASVVALELSVVVRFVLNDRWTFRDHRSLSLPQRFYLFQVSSLGSPILALFVINVVTPQLGISYLVSNSIGILLGLALNWYCSSCIVWRHPAISK